MRSRSMASTVFRRGTSGTAARLSNPDHCVVFLSVGRGMLFSNLSSLDDSLGKATLMANGRPWWMDDPELIALRERTLEELKRAIDESDPAGADQPDPIVAEFFSGAAGRALTAARGELVLVDRDRHPRIRAVSPA